MKEKLLTVVWLSSDKRAAADMALLYLRDSLIHRWFGNAQLVLWGPTVDFAAKDENIQGELELAKSVGVRIKACRSCANIYGVVTRLEDLGIEVLPMGEELSDLIKECQPVIFI